MSSSSRRPKVNAAQARPRGTRPSCRSISRPRAPNVSQCRPKRRALGPPSHWSVPVRSDRIRLDRTNCDRSVPSVGASDDNKAKRVRIRNRYRNRNRNRERRAADASASAPISGRIITQSIGRPAAAVALPVIGADVCRAGRQFVSCKLACGASQPPSGRRL